MGLTMYICVCNAVTDREIRSAVEAGCRSFDEVQRKLGVATGCGKCEPCVREILADGAAGRRPSVCTDPMADASPEPAPRFSLTALATAAR